MRVMLTSCGLETEQIKGEFLGMLGKEPAEAKALFIPTAAIDADAIEVLPKCMEDLLKCGIPKENVRVFDLHRNMTAEELKAFDVIYFCGGRTSYLLEMRRNRLLKCVLVIACIVCLLAGVPAQAASLPSGICITQAESNTGNLAAITMMLREKAYLEGYTKWADITEASVKTDAWKSNRVTAPFTYTFNGNSISVAEEIWWALPLDEIKGLLSRHPEGIVVQCDVGRHQYTGVWINSPTTVFTMVSGYKMKTRIGQHRIIRLIWRSQHKRLQAV